jgi:hypothetical protein
MYSVADKDNNTTPRRTYAEDEQYSQAEAKPNAPILPTPDASQSDVMFY